jgi:predicted HTH transcriptional regulator
MSPEAIAWLNQLAGYPLNDHQRLALVYLRHNEQLTNSEYQRLNHVDSVTANRELRGLAQLRLIEQHNTRRWAYYTLQIPAAIALTPVAVRENEEDKILAYVLANGSIKSEECQRLLGVSRDRAYRLLQKLLRLGQLRKTGQLRWSKYYLP